MDISIKKKIFNSKKLLREMLIDRGYNPSDLNRLNKEFDKTNFETDMYWEIVSKSGDEKTLISFLINKKLDNKLVESHFVKAKTLYSEKIKTVKIIMISSIVITNPTIAKNNEFMNINGIYSQTFLVDNLQFNITKSNLVPEYKLLTHNEINELPFKTSEMPRILISDPISQYYGVTKNNVFQVKMISETTGEYLAYNKVV